MDEMNKKKFYKMSIADRLNVLAEEGGLSADELRDLQAPLPMDVADYMVENAVSVYGLPLGIAQNFIVNGKPLLVPMAIEEPSVIAGASFMAKLAQPTGGFFASSTLPEMIGQIQVLDIPDIEKAAHALQEHKEEILAEATAVNTVIVSLGGGPRDLEIRLIENSPIGKFMVLHLIYDVRDAMGANAINTIAEKLTPKIEALTGGRVHLRILSNLADRRLAKATVTIRKADLAFKDFSGEDVRDGIIEAWAFAQADPYRAATHNKGIMNGIDAVVIATANDWRAIEAGAHAYAARSGRYTSLSTWGKDADGNLTGSLELPMAVGIVGGSTKAHPNARACIKLLDVKTANQLAEIIVSVGLAQNLAAIRALATEGIQKGHMTLHARKTAKD